MAFIKRALTAGTHPVAAISLTAGCLILVGCARGPNLEVAGNDAAKVPILAAPNATPSDTSGGPVRLARISSETGKVSWRPDGTTEWAAATNNLPIRQGGEVWLAPGSRLEIQFDDGSTLHLGDDAVATLQTLYSDKQGEFTEVKLAAGTSSWHLKNKYSIYQIDAPCDSVKSAGPSDFRVDIRPKADSLAVRNGDAVLSADGKDTPVTTGHYTVLDTPKDPVVVRNLGPEDPWDHYSDNRNAILSEARSPRA